MRIERCQIGNVTQQFQPGQIDDYTPLPLGNGDIGGLFDAFGGTYYDELRAGSGGQRDVRTLLLTGLVAVDYWCINGRDVAWHNFDLNWLWRGDPTEHYFAPAAPFVVRVGPPDVHFHEHISGHRQTLDLHTGTLTTRYSIDGKRVAVDTWVQAQDSLLVYEIDSATELVLDFTEAPTPRRTLPYLIECNNPDHLRVRSGYFETRVEDGLLLGEVMSNVYCPAHFAVAATAGEWSGSTLHLPPGRHQVYIAVGHQTLTEPRERVAAVKRQAVAARARSHGGLRRQHRSWWRDFWAQSYVELPDKRLETMWFRSNYYLACFLPRRVPAFNLEGAYSVFPSFAGGHTQDTAYHLIAAIGAGHPELCEGVLACMVETLPVAEATAKHAYHARGARYPWQAAPGLLPYLEGHRNPPFAEHHQNAYLVEAIRRYLDGLGWPARATRELYPIVRSIGRFWSSLLTPREDYFEIRYVPSQSQSEDWDSRDRPNIIDILLSAQWSLRVAADMGARLGVDAKEVERWSDEAARIGLHYTKLPDGSYGVHEHHVGIDGKCPAQLLGVVLAPLLEEHDPAGLRKTLDRVQQTVNYKACGFTPAYYAIAFARMREPQIALERLQEMFTFSKEPWIMFRENAPHGRMPYYLAGHAFYVQAINEMLIQRRYDDTQVLPACPFDEVEFRLPAGDRLLTVRKRGDDVQILDDSPARYRGSKSVRRT